MMVNRLVDSLMQMGELLQNIDNFISQTDQRPKLTIQQPMINQPTTSTSPQNHFTRGMTLDHYLELSRQNQPLPAQDEDISQKADEDLYVTCRQVERSCSNKMITFCIKELDEDHDQESMGSRVLEQDYLLTVGRREEEDTTVEMKPDKLEDGFNSTMYNFQGKELKKPVMKEVNRGKTFRIKHQSNSPYKREHKQVTPSKQNMIKTQGNSNGFLFNPKKIPPPQGSTMYRQLLKGDQDKSKEKYFKKKNSEDLNILLQYERSLGSKYKQDLNRINLLGIKIQGKSQKKNNK